MDLVIDLSWRIYPAAFMALAGGALAASAVWSARGWSAHRDPRHNLRFIRAFRRTVLGLAVMGIALAWIWQAGWLLVLSLTLGGGELMESSIDAWAVRRAVERDRAAAGNRR